MSLDIRITTTLDGHTIPLHDSDITSNLTTMAENVKVSPETTLFDVLWGTYDVKCSSVSPLLRKAVHALETDETLDQFNAPNGWGTRRQFIVFINELITVCEKFPSATYQ